MSVRPVLAFSRVDALTVVPSLDDVRVVHGPRVRQLAEGADVLRPHDVAAVCRAARGRRTWAHA